MPPTTSPTHLSRRERQIMDIVYAKGQATAKQVAGAMADPPGYTAVRTLLGILENKGHLKHKKRGRAFVFTPVRPRKRAGQTAFRRVVETFFDGSLGNAVASHLTATGAKLSDDELKRLENIILKARKKGT